MRHLASRSILPLALATFALATPRTAAARVQGSPGCQVPVPAPAPNSSYSCNFASMPLYNQGDPNLAFMSVPYETYVSEALGGDGNPISCTSATDCPDPWQRCTNNVCVQNAYGSPGNLYPYAQSWLPMGPMPGDTGYDGSNDFYSKICSSTAEAMALNAALAYRSSTTAITGEYCDAASPCPVGFACNGNTCTGAGASCDSGTNCPTGYHCVSNACVAAVCGATAPCPSGYTCQGTLCTPANITVARPTAPPATSPGTFGTFAFNQAAHTAWAWNCNSYPNPLQALPRGFAGGCRGGAPLDLWPGSSFPGSPTPTVFGLQQVAHMSILTNMEPDQGAFPYIGSHYWPYYISMQPFAAEMYNRSANGDGTACSTDADCNPGYCLDSPDTFHVQQPGGPQGTCASAAFQTLDSNLEGPVALTNAGLRAVIDRGGTGVIGQADYVVSVPQSKLGQTAVVTFTLVGSHYQALQGYKVSYDQYTNPTLTFTFNNPAFGNQDTSTLVDVASGLYAFGPDHLTRWSVFLPDGSTNALFWPTAKAADGSPLTFTGVGDLQDGETVTISNFAYFIYVQ